MGQLLTIEQVADRLQLYPGTVRRLIKSGKLVARRMPWKYRIKEEDLDAFINSTKIEVTDGKEA